MDGFGRFYHLLPSWLYGQASSYSNDGNIINPTQRSNYLVSPYSFQSPGALLTERKISVINNPVLSGMHSSQVYNLLMQRAVQEQHFLTAQIMESYIRGLMVFAGHRRALLGYLEGYGQRPVCTGYDLVSVGVAHQSPVLSRDDADNLMAHLKGVPGGAVPVIRQCLDINHKQREFYENQLRLNGQQLAFNGYACPALRMTMPMAYPLSDVVKHLGWLKNPGARSAGVLRAYPYDGSGLEEAEVPPDIYFTPHKEPGFYGEGESKQTNRAIHKSDPQFLPERPRFPEGRQEFKYPADILDNGISQPSKERKHIEQKPSVGKGGLAPHMSAAVEKNALKETGKAPAFSQKPEMIEVDRFPVDKGWQKKKEVTPELPKPVKESAKERKVVKPQKQVTLASAQELQKKDKKTVQAGALGQAIKLLKNISGPDSRELLDKLYNIHGRQLFASNQLPVDKEHTLEFLKLFKVAIQYELKKGKTGDAEQQKKKQERLAALSHIERFVENLDDNDPNLIPLCRLAVHLYGRVRERSAVLQSTIPFCGGFSVEQMAWGRQPLKVAKMMTELALNYEVTLPGSTRTVSIPDNKDLSKNPESLADKLFLSAVYNLSGVKGSTAYTDAVNTQLFGIPVKIYRPLKSGDGSNNEEYDGKFLEDLVLASEKKCPIRGAIDPKFAAFLDSQAKKQPYFRKKSKSVINVENDFHDFVGVKGIGHAVVLDHFNIKGEQVEFKLYSWGKVFNWSMNKATFLKHVDKRNFLVVGDYSESTCFKKIEKECYALIDGRAAVHDDQGNIQYLAKGQIIRTPHYKTVAGYDGAGFVVAADDENLILVNELNYIVRIKKKEIEKVTILPDGKRVVLNKNGKYKLLVKGEIVTSHNGDRYFLYDDGKMPLKLDKDKKLYPFSGGKKMLVVDKDKPVVIGVGESHIMDNGEKVTYKGDGHYAIKKEDS